MTPRPRAVSVRLTWEALQTFEVPEGADMHAWLASGAWKDQVAAPAVADLVDWTAAGYLADMG